MAYEHSGSRTTWALTRCFCPSIHSIVVLVALAVPPVIGITGCVEKPATNDMPSTVALSTTDNGAIERTKRSAPIAVILFQTPTECLTCSADTYRWIELTREAGGAFLIVLTEPPTAEEAAALKRMRLNFTVLREPVRHAYGVVPPALAVFRGPDTLILEGSLTPTRRSALLDSTRRMLQKM